MSGKSPIVRGEIRSGISTDRKLSVCWEQGLRPQQRSEGLEIQIISGTRHTPREERQFLPLEFQAHLIGQGMEQQHRLAPSSIDLIPFHGNTGQATQSEVIDCAELSAVPGGRQEGGGKYRDP